MTDRIAVFPLNTVLYPGGPLPLRIFETRYIDMVKRCMRNDEPFAVAALTEGTETDSWSYQEVATLARIRDFETLPDGLLGIVAEGGERVRLGKPEREADGLNTAHAETLAAEPSQAVRKEDDDLVTLLRDLLEQLPEFYAGRERHFDDATWVGYRLAEILPFSLAQKQYFLEIDDPQRRLDILRPLVDSLRVAQEDDLPRA
ncbi:MAG: LON peptidase substrate-binding domain-containing protein [Gammaproteobacteria bacterium]|nr:LON peptidase substrate-binding domain-containing protein [Gammaproteobacteria bacterium]